MTTPDVRALYATDRDKLNAMLARAVGYRYKPGQWFDYWPPEGDKTGMGPMNGPPDFFAVPVDWALVGKLIEAVPANEEVHLWRYTNVNGCVCWYADDGSPNEDAHDHPALALACMLADLGMLNVAERPEGGKP